jgi:hypothetical protein
LGILLKFNLFLVLVLLEDFAVTAANSQYAAGG